MYMMPPTSASTTMNIPEESGAFITIGEITWIHHYPKKLLKFMLGTIYYMRVDLFIVAFIYKYHDRIVSVTCKFFMFYLFIPFFSPTSWQSLFFLLHPFFLDLSFHIISYGWN